MSRRPATRADGLGVRPAAMRRHAKARIDRAKALLAEVAVHWDEVDSSVVYAVDRLLRQFDELDADIAGAIDHISQPWGDE